MLGLLFYASVYGSILDHTDQSMKLNWRTAVGDVITFKIC